MNKYSFKKSKNKVMLFVAIYPIRKSLISDTYKDLISLVDTLISTAIMKTYQRLDSRNHIFICHKSHKSFSSMMANYYCLFWVIKGFE